MGCLNHGFRGRGGIVSGNREIGQMTMVYCSTKGVENLLQTGFSIAPLLSCFVRRCSLGWSPPEWKRRDGRGICNGEQRPPYINGGDSLER